MSRICVYQKEIAWNGTVTQATKEKIEVCSGLCLLGPE